jgi:hypothetical protein
MVFAVHRGNKVLPATLERWRALAEVLPHGILDLREIKTSLKDARQTLRDLKRHNHEHRHDHLVKLTYAIDEAHGRDSEKSATLKKLHKYEE